MEKFESVAIYFAHLPEGQRQKLEEIWNFAKSLVPEASEKISYQMPTLYLNGNLVHFAGFKNHVGMYPGAAPIELFKDELAKYSSGKGTIQFSYDEPYPYELIKRVILSCVERNKSKKPKK